MFIAIILLVAVTMGVYHFRLLEVFFRQAAAAQLAAVGPSVQRFLEQSGVVPADTAAIQQLVAYVAATTQSRVLVTDSRGVILVDTVTDGRSLAGETVPSNFISRTLRQGRIDTFDYATAGADALAVSVPWVTAGRITGSLVIVGSVRTAARQTALEVSRYVLRAAMLASGVALVVAYFMSSSITDPLRKMSKAARSISKGNFSERLEVKSQDELGDLAEAMNSMSGEISALIDSLTKEKEKLQSLMDERTNMMSDISHDLRTPITSIRGFVEALRDGIIKDEAEKSRTLNIIHEESERLSRLVDDLFYLARLEAGEIPAEMKHVDVAAVVRSTVETILPLAKQKDLDVSLSVDEDAAARFQFKATGSADRLTRAVLNILDNAVKYSPHGGQIRVALSVDAGSGGLSANVPAPGGPLRAVISVSDQGPGIPEPDIAHIFERFYRADKARSRAKSGAGLGLSIARFIVEQHHGSLWVESTVGQGSTFFIAIPLQGA